MAYQREELADLARAALNREPRLGATALAARLGVHRHTLQRALAAGGASHAEMQRRLIRERLDAWLAHPGTLPVKAVWSELGFPSASSFARYVRRLTGRSPSELRERRELGRSERKRDKMALDLRGGNDNLATWLGSTPREEKWNEE